MTQIRKRTPGTPTKVRARRERCSFEDIPTKDTNSELTEPHPRRSRTSKSPQKCQGLQRRYRGERVDTKRRSCSETRKRSLCHDRHQRSYSEGSRYNLRKHLDRQSRYDSLLLDQCANYGARNNSASFPNIATDSDEGNLSRNIYKLWKKGQFCDVMFYAAGSRFYAHRLVMAAACEQFAENQNSERAIIEYHIPNVSAAVMRDIIEYFYTGSLEVNPRNLLEILAVSHKLRIRKLLNVCSSVLCRVNLNNVVQNMKVARKYDLQDVIAVINTFIHDNFLQVVPTNAFLMAGFDVIYDILSSDTFNAPDELNIFYACNKWIKHDATVRKKYIVPLMSLVRFGLIKPNDLVSKVEKEHFIFNIPECREMLFNAYKHHALYQNVGSPSSPSRSAPPAQTRCKLPTPDCNNKPAADARKRYAPEKYSQGTPSVPYFPPTEPIIQQFEYDGATDNADGMKSHLKTAKADGGQITQSAHYHKKEVKSSSGSSSGTSTSTVQSGHASEHHVTATSSNTSKPSLPLSPPTPPPPPPPPLPHQQHYRTSQRYNKRDGQVLLWTDGRQEFRPPKKDTKIRSVDDLAERISSMSVGKRKISREDLAEFSDFFKPISEASSKHKDGHQQDDKIDGGEVTKQKVDSDAEDSSGSSDSSSSSNSEKSGDTLKEDSEKKESFLKRMASRISSLRSPKSKASIEVDKQPEVLQVDTDGTEEAILNVEMIDGHDTKTSLEPLNSQSMDLNDATISGYYLHDSDPYISAKTSALKPGSSHGNQTILSHSSKSNSSQNFRHPNRQIVESRTSHFSNNQSGRVLEDRTSHYSNKSSKQMVDPGFSRTSSFGSSRKLSQVSNLHSDDTLHSSVSGSSSHCVHPQSSSLNKPSRVSIKKRSSLLFDKDSLVSTGTGNRSKYRMSTLSAAGPEKQTTISGSHNQLSSKSIDHSVSNLRNKSEIQSRLSRESNWGEESVLHDKVFKPPTMSGNVVSSSASRRSSYGIEQVSQHSGKNTRISEVPVREKDSIYLNDVYIPSVTSTKDLHSNMSRQSSQESEHASRLEGNPRRLSNISVYSKELTHFNDVYMPSVTSGNCVPSNVVRRSSHESEQASKHGENYSRLSNVPVRSEEAVPYNDVHIAPLMPALDTQSIGGSSLKVTQASKHARDDSHLSNSTIRAYHGSVQELQRLFSETSSHGQNDGGDSRSFIHNTISEASKPSYYGKSSVNLKPSRDDLVPEDFFSPKSSKTSNTDGQSKSGSVKNIPSSSGSSSKHSLGSQSKTGSKTSLSGSRDILSQASMIPVLDRSCHASQKTSSCSIVTCSKRTLCDRHKTTLQPSDSKSSIAGQSEINYHERATPTRNLIMVNEGSATSVEQLAQRTVKSKATIRHLETVKVPLFPATLSPIPSGSFDSTSTIRSLPPLPLPLVIMVMGGVNPYRREDITNGVSNSVQEYNTETNTWTIKSHLPTALRHFAVADIGGRILVAGGSRSTSGDKPVKDCYSYSVKDNRWSDVARLKTARMRHGAVELGGLVYVVGGEDCVNMSLKTIEIYDPSNDVWSFTTSMKDPRVGAGVTKHRGRIFVAGGVLDTDEKFLLDTVEVFDPKTRDWHFRFPLPIAVADASLCEVNGLVYMVGGYTLKDREPLSLDSIFRYLDESDSWEGFKTLHVPRHDAVVLSLNAKIYIIGGESSASMGNALCNVECVDVETEDHVTGLTPLAAPVYGIAGCVFDPER